MANIAQIVSSAGALSLLQIHHAGLVTPESVHPVAKAPSADPANPRSVSMEPDEIVALRDAFIAAAVRAKLAGYHGVELHGAHGYLLNQFASSLFNKRDDDYGGTPGKNLRLASEIIHGIRQSCGPEFMIGYRMGANSPTLDDGIRVANILQEAGIDILHVSHGGSLQNIPRPPRDFPFNWIVYSGTVIRKSVQIPVIVVNEIKTPERANWLIENDLTDFIALGRPQLADPAWVNKVKTGILPNHCLSCKPKCRWYENSQLCPARRNASDIQPELS
jgi:2,4-dienoyl-CoA reductase-like NADH-dependent reductase (Old Yellow Enzyme family)